MLPLLVLFSEKGHTQTILKSQGVNIREGIEVKKTMTKCGALVYCEHKFGHFKKKTYKNHNLE